MIIKALVENTSVSEDIGHEHGLALYIETENHKILFDTGAGSDLLTINAFLMDADLAEVDLVFVSHGHSDHGGGLKTFLLTNDKAPVYINEKAFEKYYANTVGGGVRFIGLDIDPEHTHRFNMTGQRRQPDDELELFSGVSCRRLNPSGNADLLMQDDDGYVPDDFAHEQNLVIRENGKMVLICGCAHCGIVNILEHFHQLYGAYPDTVIGGFHLYNPVRNISEDPEIVREIGRFLLQTGAKFYTCHCTGLESYTLLKEIMGEYIWYLSGGMTLTV